MKILFISPHPGFGGASTANQTIAEMLCEEGHEVLYVNEYNENFETKKYNISKFPIHQNRITKQYKTFKFITEYNPDYILLGIPHIGIYYFLLFVFIRLIRGISVGYIFHSLSLGTSIKDVILERLISISTIGASSLFFVSNYTRMAWNNFLTIRMSNKQKYVIYNAIKIPSIIYKNSNHKNISFVGRLSSEKRPDLFCKIAKSLSNEKLNFIIWGDGELYNSLKEEYGEFVSFRGYTNNIEKIYKETDLLCVTSLFENCPMCILEAFSYKIPCITTKVGGIPEIIQAGINGEFLEVENYSESFLNAFKKITLNYKNYQDGCYITINKFKTTSISKEWTKVLNKDYNSKNYEGVDKGSMVINK